ncbi:hypothetical protein C799_01210 [Bacteroides thetaiotaomicron dnLKV9]|uniref:Uncharacterized protein n=1 Tax=Bacteroides thetaiotaomicron dnLKV9 TaxID=1235785 RepID=R9HDV2_BACT4|nr:hypothetical protein C799_01210 [Bacteroides thetaiotaomicron dnLKV9]
MIVYSVSAIVFTVIGNLLTDFLKKKGWWV